MGLTIGSFNIADLNVQGVTLRPVLGAYELVFGLAVAVHPEVSFSCRVSISGARVTFKTDEGKSHSLGFARSDEPIEIQQCSYPKDMTPALVLPVLPGQLAAIEKVRSSGDFDFHLAITGRGIGQHGDQLIHDKVRSHMGRSDWIKKLREAEARDILLLEVPMPLTGRSGKWQEISSGLNRAEEQFRNADYHSCVASCRSIIQELGAVRLKDPDWAMSALKILSNNRTGMTKPQREVALWATLRHYTHQSHHPESEGGVSIYSRSEAQLVLTLTASFVSRAQVE